jgi:hypothetical protein
MFLTGCCELDPLRHPVLLYKSDRESRLQQKKQRGEKASKQRLGQTNAEH